MASDLAPALFPPHSETSVCQSAVVKGLGKMSQKMYVKYCYYMDLYLIGRVIYFAENFVTVHDRTSFIRASPHLASMPLLLISSAS